MKTLPGNLSIMMTVAAKENHSKKTSTFRQLPEPVRFLSCSEVAGSIGAHVSN
ncbi:hypothetical protein ACVFVO_13420 [Advenella kashmirensis]